MNNGQWALALEIVRHVEPFLGLSLDELKLLESVHNVSIRQQFFRGSLSTDDLKAFSPESYGNAFQRLHDLRILLPTTKPDTCIVNLYGLVRFYVLLAGESSPRKTTVDRLVRTETLLKSIQRNFDMEGFTLLDVEVSLPELDPRKAVRVGRTVPVMDT